MDDLIAQLSQHATQKTYKKGSIILRQNETPSLAYIVKSGTVKAYTINSAGEEQIVALHAPNEIFPIPWLFNKSVTTTYYYEAFLQCELLAIPPDTVNAFLHQPEYASTTIDYLAANYTSMLIRATALEQAKACDKIMFTLYHLLFRYGRETKPGIFAIDLPLTHGIIASMVGLTRETTSAELNKLKKQHIISYDRHAYLINKRRIERTIGEDSFKSVNLWQV